MATNEEKELQQLVEYASPTLNGLQLGAQNRQAIEMMAHEGIDLHTAAKRMNVRPDSLIRAFKRPKVKRAFNQLLKDIRENAAQAAYLRINHLAKTGTSERLRLDANRWIAGVDGISPVQKVHGQHHHSHAFQGYEYDDPNAPIDVTPDNPSSADDD